MLKTRRRYVETMELNGVVSEFHVNPSDFTPSMQERLWEIYEESLSIVESVQEQVCYTRETFFAALHDSDYHCMVMIVEGEPMGLIMATDDVEKMREAYINPAFMRARFPRQAEEHGILYITNALISPRLRHLGFIRPFMDVCMRGVAEEGHALAFDVSDSREFLVDFLFQGLHDVGYPVEKELLGRQHYYIFTPLNAS